jgi:hypothetical protein
VIQSISYIFTGGDANKAKVITSSSQGFQAGDVIVIAGTQKRLR